MHLGCHGCQSSAPTASSVILDGSKTAPLSLVEQTAAEAVGAGLGVEPAELNHAIADRLRRVHGLRVRVGPLEGALRRYDAEMRSLLLSE